MPDSAKRCLDAGDEPQPWWSKRFKTSAPPPCDGDLLKLLVAKGRRNGELRAEVDRREEELLEASVDLRSAHAHIDVLSQKVAQLQALVSRADQKRKGRGATEAHLATRSA